MDVSLLYCSFFQVSVLMALPYPSDCWVDGTSFIQVVGNLPLASLFLKGALATLGHVTVSL